MHCQRDWALGMSYTKSPYGNLRPKKQDHCPRPGCSKQKPITQYACYVHWRELPAQTRLKVSQSYSKHGALSPEWMAADEEAMKFWNQKDVKSQADEYYKELPEG